MLLIINKDVLNSLSIKETPFSHRAKEKKAEHLGSKSLRPRIPRGKLKLCLTVSAVERPHSLPGKLPAGFRDSSRNSTSICAGVTEPLIPFYWVNPEGRVALIKSSTFARFIA